MGRKKKSGMVKRQFTLRAETAAALDSDYEAFGRQTYADRSAFADGVLALAMGAERRRHARFQRTGVRARQRLFEQRDRAESNLWRVRHEAKKLDDHFDEVKIQLGMEIKTLTRPEIEALREHNPYFRVAQDFAENYSNLRKLMRGDHESVSITLRVLLKHLISGVGTDSLPPDYARQVHAAYDRLCVRRAVPPDDQTQAV